MSERNLQHKKKQHRNSKSMFLQARKHQISLHLVNGNKYKMIKRKLSLRGLDHQIIKVIVRMSLKNHF